MSTAQLPEDLVVEILSRLPVKPLLRFRCVSKPWRSLIDSPTFAESHLCNNPNSKIYVSGSDGFADKEVSLAEVDLKVRVLSPTIFDRPILQSLTLPLSPTRIEGSCNGLICVSHLDYCSRLVDILLVNPSTREYRLLPRPYVFSTRSIAGYAGLGLGYDCSAHEYKVMLISEDQRKVYIYGSKSNSWRQTDVSYEYCSCELPFYAKYANGGLHWIVEYYEHKFHIAAFDLVNEKLMVTGYDIDFFGNPDRVYLEVVGGRLCLCCGHNLGEDEGGDVMDIWVMEKYGIRESWSKLVSFDRYVTPLAFSICGRRLLFRVAQRWRQACQCRLHWYDLDKKSMECTYIGKAWHYAVCLQSIIRLERKLP